MLTRERLEKLVRAARLMDERDNFMDAYFRIETTLNTETATTMLAYHLMRMGWPKPGRKTDRINGQLRGFGILEE